MDTTDYPDRITFPSDITDTLPNAHQQQSALEKLSKLNKNCNAYNGERGLCLPSSKCTVYIPFLFQTYSQRIMQCRTPTLICCPDAENQNDRTSSQTSSTTISPLSTNQIITSMPEVTVPPPISTVKPTEGLHSDQTTPKTFAKLTSKPLSASLPNGIDFANDEEAQGTCGVLGDGFKRQSSDSSVNSNSNLWPWIVSIGLRHGNGTIDWVCLGSLITTEYILTAAHCFQRSPNIVAVGIAVLGRMTDHKIKDDDIRSLGTLSTHEKFTSPKMYKNIGLGRLTTPVRVTANNIPVCFPFLAGVLDISQFAGASAKTVGFDIPGINFHVEEYRILNNSQCSRVFDAQKAQTIKRFPSGIRSDNMCGLNRNTKLCQAPGAPLVIFDSASDSFVQIGIASGDPTCSELRRAIVTFTRLNSFSSWVRGRIGKLPSPPTCYF